MMDTFEPSVVPLVPKGAREIFCVTAPSGMIVIVDDANGAGAHLPSRADITPLGLDDAALHYLGRLGDADCWAASLVADGAFEGDPPLRARSLRALSAMLSSAEFGVAGRAVQILHWAATHRFCGRCGAENARVASERALRCPRCGLTGYPRLSPAVIVAIHRPGEILLARAASFPAAFHSVLAGFVEPGESLEQTVAREIREEVGIEVESPRYFGSQPWPFPHSLMIAFDAAWASGEVCADGVEIVHAGWYRKGALPTIPPSLSIARRLIDAWSEGAFD